MIYTVRLNGNPVKDFASVEEAKVFMVNFIEVQTLTVQSLRYLDDAVDRSDLSEAKQVIANITGNLGKPVQNQ